MSEDFYTPIDRYLSAVDLIEDQLKGWQSVAEYLRKYDSLITLKEVIVGKRHENPIKSDEYVIKISKLQEKIMQNFLAILGFNALDSKRVLPLFIRLLQGIDLKKQKFDNIP